MHAPFHSFRLGVTLLVAASVGFVATPARAGGDGAAAGGLPAVEKKVFTNDDLEAKYGKPPVTAETKAAQTVAAAAPAKQAPAPSGRAAAARIPREKNPVWYAEQSVAMSDELAAIDVESQRLILFRAPGNTPRAGTGMILSAPCEGISTDNRIAQLAQRRQEIQLQMDDLEDMGRRNGMPPGIFRDADAIAAAAQPQIRLTLAQQRASLLDRVDELSAELAQTEGVVGAMQADTAARRMTLLRSPGYGGNPTTDLLDRLDAHSNALQNEMARITDQALSSGIPARDLP